MALIVAVILITSLGNSVFNIYMPIYLGEVAGLSELELGILYSVSPLTRLAATLIAGAIVDRLGPFRSLVLTLATSAALITSIASLTMWGYAGEALLTALLPIYSSLSFVSMITEVAGDRLLIDITRPEVRGTLISALAVLVLISQTLSPAFGAFLWKILPALTLLTTTISFLASIPLLIAAWKLRTHR